MGGGVYRINVTPKLFDNKPAFAGFFIKWRRRSKLLQSRVKSIEMYPFPLGKIF
jgi:hypothetical protein